MRTHTLKEWKFLIPAILGFFAVVLGLNYLPGGLREPLAQLVAWPGYFSILAIFVSALWQGKDFCKCGDCKTKRAARGQ